MQTLLRIVECIEACGFKYSHTLLPESPNLPFVPDDYISPHRSFFTPVNRKVDVSTLSEPQLKQLLKREMALGLRREKGTMYLMLHHMPPEGKYARKQGNKAFLK